MTPTRRQLLGGSVGWLALGAAGCSREAWWSAIDPREPGESLVAPAGGDLDLASHVLLRTSFGLRPGDREELLGLAPTVEAAVDAWLARQLAPEGIDDAACERAVRRFETLREPIGELYEYREHVLRRELVGATLQRAVLSRRQLREVMCHFWSDHFNIDLSKGECAWLKVADDREVVRRHALGRFEDLLRASASSPAMLWYLDGRVNRKASPDEKPNENYARELLELHTLGVDGGYTQEDVMEVARCLTGWTARDREGFFKGRVEFRAHLHDDGEKRVLGERIAPGGGEQDLERVLAIVAAHPSTARHLSRKLCRRFLSDEAEGLDEVAAAFASSGGDIAATLAALFAHAAFRDPALRGAKLKRPFHFLASCLRATEAASDCGPPITNYLERMGQAPFQHPTPDGYPEDAAAWTGTLLWRWRFAAELAGGGIAGTRFDATALTRRLGGAAGTLAHFLGRAPAPAELEAAESAGGDLLALALASPAFQRC